MCFLRVFAPPLLWPCFSSAGIVAIRLPILLAGWLAGCSCSLILVFFNLVPLAPISSLTATHRVGLRVCKMQMISFSAIRRGGNDAAASPRRLSVLWTLLERLCDNQMSGENLTPRYRMTAALPAVSPCSDSNCLHIYADAGRRSRA